MEKNKILYVGSMIFPNESAGVQRSFALSKSFKDLGYDVSLLGLNKTSQKSSEIKEETINGFNCYSYKVPSSIFEWTKHTFSIGKIKKTINLIGVNTIRAIVLMEYEAIPLLKLVKFCKKHSIYLIADTEEWYGKSNFSFPKNIVKDFDTSLRMKYVYPKKINNFICISSFLYGTFSHGKNACIIPGTIDRNDNKWIFSKPYKPNKILTIGYAGSPGIKFEKERLDLLIDSIIKLNSEGKRINLKICGVNDSLLNKTFPNISSYPFIFNYGIVSHFECLKMIQCCDFSTIIREKTRVTLAGFPTKLSESFGCNTPVISTDTSDISKYIACGKTGYIINGYKLNDIKNCLLEILNVSPDDINKMHLFLMKEKPLEYSDFTNTLKKFIDRLK